MFGFLAGEVPPTAPSLTPDAKPSVDAGPVEHFAQDLLVQEPVCLHASGHVACGLSFRATGNAWVDDG